MTAPSPFLNLPPDAWLASNDLAFAVPDGFPVAPGHALVLTKRLVPTWFDATLDEMATLNYAPKFGAEDGLCQDRIQLFSLNPACRPIEVDPEAASEMQVV